MANSVEDGTSRSGQQSPDVKEPSVKEHEAHEAHEPYSALASNKVEALDTVADPVLARKIALVSAALEQIGMTTFHWKIFFLTGFGYAADSFLICCQSIAQPAVMAQYASPDTKLQGIALASMIGLLVGAAFWGLSADIIGRKWAFNASLLLAGVFVVIAGGMPGYVSFSTLVALYSSAVGGNYILDSTSLLEFVPRNHGWLVTLLAIWWAVGYTIAGLLAWVFMTKFSCPAANDPGVGTCTYASNMGWRYLHFTTGGIVLVLGVLRVTLVRMGQTPKWLVGQNRDEEAVEALHRLAQKYNRPCDLTVEDLRKEGTVSQGSHSRWSTLLIAKHVTELFATRKLAWSYTIITLNWLVIGMVSSLYYVFLPYYLASQNRKVGEGSADATWRDYAITQTAGIFGPIIAAFLVETNLLGRRGTMAVGAALTMIFAFAYTQIKTPAQNVGISSATNAASNIYYAVLYAYTPEILPTAHRATGYAVCVVVNRLGGISGVLVGSYANIHTSVPLFVISALYASLVVLSLVLPFESRGRRTG